MKIWMVDYDAANDYAIIELSDEDGSRELKFFDGTLVSDDYLPLRGVMHGEIVGDFSYFGAGKLVCNEHATLLLAPYIASEVQILPLDIAGWKYYAINVTNVIDCLDEEKSEIRYFKNSRRVKDIKKHVFDDSLVEHALLFKIPQNLRSTVYATERFKNLVEQLELTGLAFDAPYSSLQVIRDLAAQGFKPPL